MSPLYVRDGGAWVLVSTDPIDGKAPQVGTGVPGPKTPARRVYGRSGGAWVLAWQYVIPTPGSPPSLSTTQPDLLVPTVEITTSLALDYGPLQKEVEVDARETAGVWAAIDSAVLPPGTTSLLTIHDFGAGGFYDVRARYRWRDGDNGGGWSAYDTISGLLVSP